MGAVKIAESDLEFAQQRATEDARKNPRANTGELGESNSRRGRVGRLADGLWRITWQEDGFAKTLGRGNDHFGRKGDRLAEHEPGRRHPAALLAADPRYPAASGWLLLLHSRFRAASG